MRSVQFVILFALFCSTAAAEQTVEYDWLTQGKVSGRLELVIHDDGERSAHFEFNDRGRGPSLDERYRVGADGLIKFYETHGRAYMGAPVDERFVFEDGSARWKSELESGRAEGGLDAFYLANDATPEQTAALARALLAATDRTLRLWPSGTARVEQLAEVVVKHESQSVEANLFAIFGLGFGPGYVWLDEDRELFAISSGGMGLTRAGWRDVLPALAQRQRAAEQAHFRQLASELTHQTPAALCLKNFSVLDVDGGRTMPASTVRIEDGVITAVGADDSIDCKGLATIDGNGQTLLPGLWDMHVHTSADDGPLHLAAGVTSVRDLGNDHDDLTAVIEQFEQGRAMGPTVYRAGFIDAAGPFAAPSDNLATSLDEAMAYIEQLDTQGYRHIKIYSSIAPEWVAPMADEMHRRGIRLSGHVPSGMSTAKAIRDGFDEIQHINMLFLNFLAGPEDDTRTPLRFSLVAEGLMNLAAGEESEMIGGIYLDSFVRVDQRFLQLPYFSIGIGSGHVSVEKAHFFASPFGLFPVEFNGFSVIGNPVFIVPPRSYVGVAPGEIGGSQIGIETYRFLGIGEGFLVLAFLQIGVTSTGPGQSVFRLQFNGLVVGGNGLVQPPQLQ